jgi:predicted Zn-dependent peptidase
LFIPKQLRHKIIETRKDISQANVLISADVLMPERSKIEKMILLDLLSEVYNGMSGRLFSKVREEHNLVYRIHFNCSQYSNGMLNWNVSLGLDKDKIDKAYDLILKELTRPITKKELEIATTKVIGTQAIRIENLDYLAEQIAYSSRNQTSWNDYLFNYEKNTAKYRNQLQDFLTDMNFKENILVGITPEA